MMFARLFCRKPVNYFVPMCGAALNGNFTNACAYACNMLHSEAEWINANIFSNRKILDAPVSLEKATEHVAALFPNANVVDTDGMAISLGIAMHSEDYYDMSCSAIKYLTEFACFLRNTMAKIQRDDDFRVVMWKCSRGVVANHLKKELVSLKIYIIKAPLDRIANLSERQTMSATRAAEAEMPLKETEAEATY